MPAIIFATPVKCSEIKAANKTLKGFDDKNLLDSMLHYQFKQAN